MAHVKRGDIVENVDNSYSDPYRIEGLSEDGAVAWCIDCRTGEERRMEVASLVLVGEEDE
jgi:hypothetical protein